MNKEEIDEILIELENHDILSASEDTYLLDYIKTLQQENKQLKERIDKYENVLKEIEKSITKIKTDIEPWTIYNVDGEILFNIKLEIDKFKELEKGDNNESNRFIK